MALPAVSQGMAPMSEAHGPPKLTVVVESAGTEPVPTDSVQEAVKQPAYGVRADSPGPRGCWALKRDETPCGAARRADGDYCNAHSGLGIAKNPAEWAPLAQRASAESRRRRATLRLALGRTGLSTPRGVLKAAVFAEAERVASAALAGLEAENPTARSKAALALLDAVDPLPKAAELVITDDLDAEGVAQLGTADLLALAERMGIDPSPPQLTSTSS